MGISFPYNLTNGTTADADEVQANLDEIKNNFDQDTIEDASANATEFQATKLPATGSLPTSGRDEIKTLRYQILQLMKLLNPAITTWDEVPAFLNAVAVLTTLQVNDTSADHKYVFGVSELAANRTITLPLLTGNDVFVFADFIQTLTNKTLASPTLNTPTVSGAISGALEAGDGIQTDGVHTLKTKIVNIGAWDMDGTSNINVAHGLGASYTDIREITTLVRSDAGTVYPLNCGLNITDTTPQGTIIQVGNPNVNLARLSTGLFDAVGFDLTSNTIDNAAAVDKGDGTVGIPVTGHDFNAKDNTTIAGTTNYDGNYDIVSQTTNEIVITATYVAETFAGTETASWSRGWMTITYIA